MNQMLPLVDAQRQPAERQSSMIESTRVRLLCCVAAALGLAACAGGEIGGTVSGLGTERSLTLLNNGLDPLTVTANGPFVFADSLLSAASYAVTVMTQPVGQDCTVSNGSGTLDAEGTSIDGVVVSCATTASLTGTLSGLVGGTAVTLRNGNVPLALTANGPFAFPGIVSDGTPYNVEVLTQPAGTNCTVANASGSFVANVATNIGVTCSPT